MGTRAEPAPVSARRVVDAEKPGRGRPAPTRPEHLSAATTSSVGGRHVGAGALASARQAGRDGVWVRAGRGGGSGETARMTIAGCGCPRTAGWTVEPERHPVGRGSGCRGARPAALRALLAGRGSARHPIAARRTAPTGGWAPGRAPSPAALGADGQPPTAATGRNTLTAGRGASAPRAAVAVLVREGPAAALRELIRASARACSRRGDGAERSRH